MEEAELVQETPQKNTISVFLPKTTLFRALETNCASAERGRTGPRNTKKRTRFQFVCGPQNPLVNLKLLIFVFVKRSKSDDFCPKKDDFLLFRALKTDCAASAEWKRPNWSKKHLKKTRFQFFWPSKTLSVTLKTPGCFCLTNRWC